MHRHSSVDFLGTVAIVVLAFTILRGYWPVEEAARDPVVFASIATIAGTLLGFAVTAISVLIAFLGGDEFEWLRSNPDYDTLFGDFKKATILFGITTILALVSLLLVNDKNTELRAIVLLAVTLWLTLMAGVTLAHALRILWLAIKAHSMAARDQ